MVVLRGIACCWSHDTMSGVIVTLDVGSEVGVAAAPLRGVGWAEPVVSGTCVSGVAVMGAGVSVGGRVGLVCSQATTISRTRTSSRLMRAYDWTCMAL